MEQAGLETDVSDIDLDEVARHPAFGAEMVRSAAIGVVGRADLAALRYCGVDE